MPKMTLEVSVRMVPTPDEGKSGTLELHESVTVTQPGFTEAAAVLKRYADLTNSL